MRLTVLGGCGAWPDAGQACSGYLVEHDGYRLLVDPGYATLPRLLHLCTADKVDAVYVSHGHPDHCADLNPLLRARTLTETPGPPLPVYAPHGALDALLALDRPGWLDPAYVLQEFTPGDHLDIGPFGAQTRLLPHPLPNAGVRLSADDEVLAYTGDTGPSSDLAHLARGADLLLALPTAEWRDAGADRRPSAPLRATQRGRGAAGGPAQRAGRCARGSLATTSSYDASASSRSSSGGTAPPMRTEFHPWRPM